MFSKVPLGEGYVTVPRRVYVNEYQFKQFLLPEKKWNQCNLKKPNKQLCQVWMILRGYSPEV